MADKKIAAYKVVTEDREAPMRREALKLCLELKARFSLQVHKYIDAE